MIDQVFTPRPSIPLNPIKLPPIHNTLVKTTPLKRPTVQTPKVNYPVLNPVSRPSFSIREESQKKLQAELAQAEASRKNLDQIIEQAANMQSMKLEQKKVEKPKYQAPRQFWWPQEVKKVQPIPKPQVKTVLPSPAPIIAAPPKVDISIEPVAPITVPRIQTKVNPPKTVAAKPKSAQTDPDFLDYLLPTITPYENPYQERNRSIVIYSFKTIGYLIFALGLYELRNYILSGLNINSFFEVFSIWLISAIFLFFGGNLNIIFKPVNPYQIHEV
jgi:hypothetical protein